MALHCKMSHQTGHWLLVLDCSIASNTPKRAAVLEDVTTRASALSLFMTKCYGDRPPYLFFQIDTGELRNIPSNTDVHQGGALGLALSYMPMGDILRKFRARFEPTEAQGTAYMDDIASFCVDISPHTAQAIAYLKGEVRQVGVTLNETKTVALPRWVTRRLRANKGCWWECASPRRRRRELSSVAFQWAPTPS